MKYLSLIFIVYLFPNQCQAHQYSDSTPIKDSNHIDTMFFSCPWKHYKASVYYYRKSGLIKTFKNIRFDTFFFDFSTKDFRIKQGTPFFICIKYRKRFWLRNRWLFIDALYETKKHLAIIHDGHAKNKYAFMSVWLDNVDPPMKCRIYTKRKWYSLKRRWYIN